MRYSTSLVLVVLIFFLTSCNSALTPSVGEPLKEIEGADTADNITGDGDMRLVMPGKSHYDKACASCHEGAVARAPHREMLYMLPPEAHYAAMTEGLMVQQASALTDMERIEVAEFLGGMAMGSAIDADIPSCDKTIEFDVEDRPEFGNWGSDRNQRNLSSLEAGISQDMVHQLTPLWSLGFPNANRMRSQPTLAGGYLFVGTHGGGVYALDQESGCKIWRFKAAGEVRTGISIDPWAAGDLEADPQIYFGDVIGNVYAVKARSGKLVWRDRADDHANATITGAPSLYDGVLYVPVSALEVITAADPNYECCTSRGSVVAYDTRNGSRKWKTYAVPEEPTLQGVNAAGVNMYGPSGAPVWNSPTIDASRNQLYIGSGENTSSPANDTSDAIIALDLDTGDIKWVYQALSNDAWNVSCLATKANCPKENGPDYDMSSTMLVTTSSDNQLVMGGQKSGHVHAVNPDSGQLVWKKKVGRGGVFGGVHFGMAVSEGKIFVPVSDKPDGREYDTPGRPGLYALDAETGDVIWYSPSPTNVCADRDFCAPGVSQAITVISGKVFAGGLDGVMRIHDPDSGDVLFEIDTTETFTTISGGKASGGAFSGGAGPMARNGMVVLSSGYAMYGHMPGNLLLALKPQE